MIDYKSISDENFHFGIVIDAGSSGSRLHVYKWLNSDYILNHYPQLSNSVPHILSNSDWNRKISPGLSFYGKLLKDKLWDDHLALLIEFAKLVIPVKLIPSTPIFIQATAGMRLLPKSQQKSVLNNICSLLTKRTKFLIKNCPAQFQIIDGETEGVYGWLALNYLSKKFNDFNVEDPAHPSLGFMDMGGASTQLAFVPSNSSEVQRHTDDLAVVTLRSINGDLQKWNVFVSTWLGFGANQAKKRYIKNLASLNGYDSDEEEEEEKEKEEESDDEEGKKPRTISDPCTPKGLVTEVEISDKIYTVKGIGDYDLCLKQQYPLLLKNRPCIDQPCLFNGIHAPQIDFQKDKFIGISEYWYTINDIFNMGGTYSFKQFNANLKQFCESDWQNEIIKNFNDNKYNNIHLDFLKDSCFKGSWVVNILHEGFNLPRIDFEKSENDPSEEKFYFKSAAQINGHELSWTLGKMLLYASSLIATNSKSQVGILPSDNERKTFNKHFIPGNFELSVVSKFNNLPKSDKISKINWYFSIFIFFVVVFSVMLIFLNKKLHIAKLLNSFLYQSSFGKFLFRINQKLNKKFGFKFRNVFSLGGSPKNTLYSSFDEDINLEEGLALPDTQFASNNDSYLNLNFNSKSPPSFNFYNSGSLNNSTASLYSVVSYNGNSSTSNLANPITVNPELEKLPQLRSRVSLHNLSNNNNTNFLHIYKSPRFVNLTGNLPPKDGESQQ